MHAQRPAHFFARGDSASRARTQNPHTRPALASFGNGPRLIVWILKMLTLDDCHCLRQSNHRTAPSSPDLGGDRIPLGRALWGWYVFGESEQSTRDASPVFLLAVAAVRAFSPFLWLVKMCGFMHRRRWFQSNDSVDCIGRPNRTHGLIHKPRCGPCPIRFGLRALGPTPTSQQITLLPSRVLTGTERGPCPLLN